VQSGEGAVVWLVPSDTILEQTLAALKNIDHPYRQRLQKDFPAGVEVYSTEQLINGQNFQNLISVQEHLSVFVLSYDSFRTSKEDGRQAYRENEKLRDFPVSDTLPEGADETSLVNAINVLNPIVIVDESHHAAGQLSIKMLQNPLCSRKRGHRAGSVYILPCGYIKNMVVYVHKIGIFDRKVNLL
jgi:type III restriction enzyme